MVLTALALLVLIACGDDDDAPPSSPTPPSAAQEPTSAAADPGQAAPLPVVELLHAVPSAVSVSSAYHDDVAQARKLVDGDMSTAWNSRTGDLVGAYIDVRIPESATVSSFEITAGFTREGGATDLFTGNHRVKMQPA